MNIATSHKTLCRLWAAVYCDFESVLAKFMLSKGWRYAHFAKVCREAQITLVMHITQARGKSKDEHYYRTTDIIFQLSKDLWLHADDAVKGRPKTVVDKAMELKRGLGGFFLLYTMYEKQPIPGRVKIAVGLEDLKALNKFCEDVQEVPFRSEVNFMLEYLVYKGAFHFCAFPEDFRFDQTTRTFLNSSRSEIVALTKRMRDVQDALGYSSTHDHVELALNDVALAKNDVAKDMLKTIDRGNLDRHLQETSAFTYFFKTLTTDNLSKALDKIDALIDKPVVTLQSLTATEAIERRMMMETRRRMERARKKALQTGGRDAEPKASRPYVREGGIFGRKKEVDEGDDKCKRRERGACSGNLWVYINGYDFDRPMGDPTGEAEPDVKEDYGDFESMEI